MKQAPEVDPRILIQSFAAQFYKAEDVSFTGDMRIRRALKLMLERDGETKEIGHIGWQGYFLYILVGKQFMRVDMQSKPFEQAFNDLGYKKGKAA